jgi:hypothetical protein
MIENGENLFGELCYVDMDEFAFWLQNKYITQQLKRLSIWECFRQYGFR